MKSVIRLLTLGFLNICLVTWVQAQASSPAPAGDKSAVAGATNAARTDIYHVHFAHAALGKAADLGEALKTPGPGPNQPAPGHIVVLRHQYGDSWDYCVIAHYGTKFTIEAARQQLADARRDLSDWHNDTIVNGPSWAEFSRALGLDSKASNAVYVVSYYRTAPGQRDAAEKNLAQPPDPATDKAAGTVLMQHLEGSPWQYLGVVRYNSWQDLATSEANSVPTTSKKDSPWSQMRQSVSNHTDTLCDRLAP